MKSLSLLSPGLAVLCVGLLGAPSFAQGVYRIVGPDGRVTFSDKPPSDTGSAAANPAAGAAPAAGGQLPYELRQASSRYPVTLYTSGECAPCNSGRNLLNARGIPYTERTVSSPQDGEALRRINPEGTLPLLTIGSQQLKGYSDGEWTQYLDAAGYPKESKLPSSYRRPAPAPLAPAAPAAPAGENTGSTPRGSTAATPAPVPVAPPVTNPAGIRF